MGLVCGRLSLLTKQNIIPYMIKYSNLSDIQTGI